MEEMSYKDKIKKFLEDERYYSLLIKGKWGVGKTYLWKKAWKEILETNNSSTQSFWEKFKKDFYFTAHLKLIITCLWNFSKTSISFLCKYFCHHDETSEPEKNIIYISLFGKESYKEVLEEVVLKAYATNRLLYLFRNLTLWNVSMGTFLTLLTKKDFKNTIVCFDDIERKSHNFRMKDFLGLVYQLKEDKCKVVIISNIDELPNYEKKIFESYENKSIDLPIEIKSKREVIYQILKEKLKDEYCEKLFPENIYKIENLRNLNKIIEAFKFFSQELNFENELKKKEELKDLFTYVFELIVAKINDDEKSKDNPKRISVEKTRTVEEVILEKSKNSINKMIDDYMKNSTFLISLPTIKDFEKEVENHYFYTLMRKLKRNFDTVLMHKKYSKEMREEIRNIISEIEREGYVDKFVSEILHDNYASFRIFDFLAIIEVLKLDDSTITNIKQKLIERLRHKSNEWIVQIICGNNKCLKEYAKKVSTESNTNTSPSRPAQKNEVYERILFRIYNYDAFINFIKHDNAYFEHEGFKEVIKGNKIILQYIHYLANDNEFKNEYSELHEILCLFLKKLENNN